ncbi:hypothetical protein JGU66_17360 [Myxococcaceae bacterium JPH2]|nr:hypothetical protein [Myxococcaceae bacterium JPH2]
MRFRSLAVLVVGAVLAVGCGKDPVGTSSSVGINLKSKASDIKSGTIEQDKSITSESSNPYGAFVNDARAKLDGHDPSRITVSSLTLLLGAQSTGVTALEQVFSGKVEVLFVMNDTNNTFPVGSIQAPTGTGPVSLTVAFDSDTMGAEDRAKLLNGSFKTVIRGPATAGFTSSGSAVADLQLSFVFEAFE